MVFLAEENKHMLEKEINNNISTELGAFSSEVLNSRKRAVQIDRPVYTEDDLVHLRYNAQTKEEASFSARVCDKLKDTCSVASLVSMICSLFPVILWLPKYQIKKDIVRDLAAGLTLGIMQIPQGMAYGMLTTLPAIYGLYASFVPVFVYFIFGTSRHLNIGTFAIVCLMVGELVEYKVSPMLDKLPVNGTASDEYEQLVVNMRVKYAVTATFLVGIFQVVFGLLRFGFITIFLSDPLISGFTTGAAFHVFSSQVKHLVGMKISRDEVGGVLSLFKLYIYIFKNITSVNYGALIIGVVAAAILYVIKYFSAKYKDKIKFPIPAELIVVILGTGLSYGLKFNTKLGIPVLKHVPTGMPPVSLPLFSEASFMAIDCLSIAIVSYAISVSVAKAFAKKNKYVINANQEFFAYGLVNIVGSFFSCHVASGSLSRSLIQENLGSTQFASLFSCVLVLLTLTVLGPCFEPLPNAILAGIVLVALRGLFKQFSVLKTLLKVSKIDAFVWMSSFTAVICFGVEYGLGVGLILNLLTTIVRTARPSKSSLGHGGKQGEAYTLVSLGYGQCPERISGVHIFQFHAPLLYINVDHFQECLYEATVNPAVCVTVPVPKCYQSQDNGMNDFDEDDATYMYSNGDEVLSRRGSNLRRGSDFSLFKAPKAPKEETVYMNSNLNGDEVFARRGSNFRRGSDFALLKASKIREDIDEVSLFPLTSPLDEVFARRGSNLRRGSDFALLKATPKLRKADFDDDYETCNMHSNGDDLLPRRGSNLRRGSAPLIRKRSVHLDLRHFQENCLTIPIATSENPLTPLQTTTDNHLCPLHTATENPLCPLHTIILDCSQISYADTMGIAMLVSVCTEFKDLQVDVHLCNTPNALAKSLALGGFLEVHGTDNIFVSIHDAVRYAQSKEHLTGICDPSVQKVIMDSNVQSDSVETEKSENRNSEDEDDGGDTAV